MNLCSAAALLLFALSAVQVTASSAGNRALGKSTLIPDAATATTTATTPATGQSMAARRPNILVIMAEDLGPRIGAFGDRLASTPNIDRLAATGVRFPNTFTAAGVCAPSRAAFITGVHQNTLGAQHMRTSTSPLGAYLAVPPPEVKAFPELLRAVGYYTFTDRKLDYQFSGIFAGTGPATIWDAEGVGAHFSGRAADQPFFGLLNLFITHESATFSSSRLEAAGDTGGAAVARAAEQARASLPVRTDPDQVSVPPYYPDTPEVRAEIATFYDNVALMDLEVGRILGDLENAGLLDSTIVLWTTDHGDALPRAKRELFDSGIRVPLVVHWPVHLRPAARAPGSVDARLVSFVDFAPTLLAFAGVAPSPFHQGGNFLSDPPRRYVFAARDRVDEQVDRVRAVRDAQHKYLRFHLPGTPGAYPIAYRDNQVIMRTLWDELAAGRLTPTQRLWFEPRPPEALYDLARDPHEVNNLAEDPAHRQTLERMRAALDDWQQRVPDLGAGDEAGMRERF
ncbi:MAG: sulfatase, partial [Pseudomonadales bacterium]|nr:sulfatase [Pseudomonadales bacterium]